MFVMVLWAAPGSINNRAARFVRSAKICLMTALSRSAKILCSSRRVELAGWYPADAITLTTGIEIVDSVLFDRWDPEVQVRNLFYKGRHQDLAFEKPVGISADRRHHVRTPA
jgi:hypothetical protein